MYIELQAEPAGTVYTEVCITNIVAMQDGRAVSATVAAASLCFCRLFDSSVPAIRLFSSRRFPPAMTASQQRYISRLALL